MTSTTQHHPSVYEGSFSGANNLKLFYRSWYPAAELSASAVNNPVEKTVRRSAIKGVLALVHGLGEHSGRYCAVFKSLTAAGYAVFAFDNQGHGKSEGQRGHITRWQNYRDNIEAFLQLVRKQEPTAPLCLMGDSLGGLIVLDYILRNGSVNPTDIGGVVVSAPPVQPCSGTVSKARVLLAQTLSGLFPRFPMKMDLNGGELSRDQQVASDAEDDPLNHPYVTLRWGSETLNTMKWVRSHISMLQLPILLIHGDADPIMDYEGSCEIFEQINSAKKTLKIYEGSYHEPHNDLDADIVMSDLVSWLNQTLVS